ncbi:PQQ-binding-like beta-propeller repeat protein [Cellulomonas sp. P22]|uniref:outer membrane protein assembly factor BamB family protein n=1 Tax=Cellulomonas sp. P22 TaxID=3373189 RepID=UPI0037A1D72A
MRRRSGPSRQVVLVEADDRDLEGRGEPALPTPLTGEPGDVAPHPRRRWWPLLVAVALVLGLVATQAVLDARERAHLAEIRSLPGVLLPVDQSMHALWTDDATGSLTGAVDLGGGSVAVGALDDSGAQVVRGVELRTGAVLWEVPVAQPEAAALAMGWSPYCEETSTPGLLACTAYGTFAADPDDPSGQSAVPTERHLVVVDAHAHVVRAQHTLALEAFTTVTDNGYLAAEYADGTVTVTSHDLVSGTEQWRFDAPDEPLDDRYDNRAWVEVDGLSRLLVTGPRSTWVLSSDGTLLDTQGTLAGSGAYSRAGHARGDSGELYYLSDVNRTVVLRADGTPGEAFDDTTINLTVDDGSAPDLFFTAGYADGGMVVRAREISDGSIRWEAPMVGAGSGGVLVDGALHVTSLRTATAIDAATGEVRWSHELEGTATDGGIVTDGRVVLVVESTYERQSLVALSLADGTRQWQISVPTDDYLNVVAGHLCGTTFTEETVGGAVVSRQQTTVYGVTG